MGLLGCSIKINIHIGTYGSPRIVSIYIYIYI